MPGGDKRVDGAAIEGGPGQDPQATARTELVGGAGAVIVWISARLTGSGQKSGPDLLQVAGQISGQARSRTKGGSVFTEAAGKRGAGDRTGG